jgi:hypothetical protein
MCAALPFSIVLAASLTGHLVDAQGYIRAGDPEPPSEVWRAEMAQMRQCKRMSERARRTTRYVVLTALIFAIGVTVASVGSVLRDTLCLGGGSECNGARPISEPIGVTLYLLGSGIALTSPALAVGTFVYMRRRRRSNQGLNVASTTSAERYGSAVRRHSRAAPRRVCVRAGRPRATPVHRPHRRPVGCICGDPSRRQSAARRRRACAESRRRDETDLVRSCARWSRRCTSEAA